MKKLTSENKKLIGFILLLIPIIVTVFLIVYLLFLVSWMLAVIFIGILAAMALPLLFA